MICEGALRSDPSASAGNLMSCVDGTHVHSLYMLRPHIALLVVTPTAWAVAALDSASFTNLAGPCRSRCKCSSFSQGRSFERGKAVRMHHLSRGSRSSMSFRSCRRTIPKKRSVSSDASSSRARRQREEGAGDAYRDAQHERTGPMRGRRRGSGRNRIRRGHAGTWPQGAFASSVRLVKER